MTGFMTILESSAVVAVVAALAIATMMTFNMGPDSFHVFSRHPFQGQRRSFCLSLLRGVRESTIHCRLLAACVYICMYT